MMHRQFARLLPAALLLTGLGGLGTACASNPALVAQAVDATLAAMISPTPVVVVVTVDHPVTVTPSLTPVTPPTETPAPSSTPAPTVTPLPPSPSPTPPPPLALGALLWQDDFTDPGQWFQSDDIVQRTEVKTGQLGIQIKLPERFALTYNASLHGADFYASIIGQAPVCAERDRYGLLFRVQDGSNYYLLDVDCEQRFRLAKIVADQRTALQDWTFSEVIHPLAEPNELGIRAEHQTLEVFINETPLVTVADDTFSSGGFGLYAGTGRNSINFSASFQSLAIWSLK